MSSDEDFQPNDDFDYDCHYEYDSDQGSSYSRGYSHTPSYKYTVKTVENPPGLFTTSRVGVQPLPVAAPLLTPRKKMDEFVKKALDGCGCGYVSNVFAENEIDEMAFRQLTRTDLARILEGNVGPQTKIFNAIQALKDAEMFGKYSFNGSASGYSAPVAVASGFKSSGGSTEDGDVFEKINSMIQKLSIPGGLYAGNKGHVNGVEEIVVHDEKVTSKPVSRQIREHQEKLSIYIEKSRLVEMIKTHQVLIVVGETGSGKSTQLPKFMRDAGCGESGKIGITQPRRIACISLATRVAQELGIELGDDVGYRIRFDNKTGLTTVITYMTDGTLLQEMANEPRIFNYSAIMLDEAHERNLNTDILFGLLKAATKKRPDLKVIVTSATLDSDKFSKYFNNAPVCHIRGRTFPVQEVYKGDPGPDYETACSRTVMEIHHSQPPGDILVFLCGEDKIEKCYDDLVERDVRGELWLLTCYAALPMEEQGKVFEPTPEGYKRKVVIATNIAETSLTIDGIVYVVDSGVAKVSTYDPKTGMKNLKVQTISKAQATQRKGRAGRTQPGVVYRLYSQYKFQSMAENAIPEIQRSNLENAILLLAAHGVEDLYNFDFIDPPPRETIDESIRELKYLEALDSSNHFTALGRTISKFPLDPRLAKVLIVSSELGCTDDILTIVALLSVQSSTGKVFERSKKNRAVADRLKARFMSAQGDYRTYLNIYKEWTSNYRSETWCKTYYINYNALVEAEEIRTQLEDVARQQNLMVRHQYCQDPNAIEKAFVSGYFSRIAMKSAGHGYTTWAGNGGGYVYIHPASALFKQAPSWVLYEEQMNTGSKTFMRNLIKVEPAWLLTYAKAFVNDFRKRFYGAI